MSIVYLILSLIFLITGLQFLRGKWVKLAIHRKGVSEERKIKNAAIFSPGVIGMGIGLFCFGFFKASLWISMGQIIFLLSFAYVVIFTLMVFLNPNRDND